MIFAAMSDAACARQLCDRLAREITAALDIDLAAGKDPQDPASKASDLTNETAWRWLSKVAEEDAGTLETPKEEAAE